MATRPRKPQRITDLPRTPQDSARLQSELLYQLREFLATVQIRQLPDTTLELYSSDVSRFFELDTLQEKLR